MEVSLDLQKTVSKTTARPTWWSLQGWALARAEGRDMHQAPSEDADNSQVNLIGGHLLTTLQWKAPIGCRFALK